MKKEEKLDILFGEALERLNQAAGIVKNLPELGEKKYTRHLGRAIVEIWEVRERIYQVWPGLKLAFVSEYEEDKNRYEALQSFLYEAQQFEEEGKFEEAEAAYQNVIKASSYGYFKMQAEAGLYRISKKST